jgi:hypothetical protein
VKKSTIKKREKIMKKITCTAMVFAFVANVSAQLKVDAAGDARFSGGVYLESSTNFITTTNDVPITFKVNGLLAGTTGSPNTANVSLGLVAHAAMTTGEYNTTVGFAALYRNTTGSDNTASGYRTLYSNTTGSSNTAYGNRALYSNTTSSFNTAIGRYALYWNTGYSNTASGYSALYSNTTGSCNVANGINALYSNTTGSYNVAGGINALYGITGSHNTALGYSAGGSNVISVNNATAIGSGTNVTSSNQVRIGNSSVTSIGGYSAWTTFADGRAKKNIRADVPGLDFINRLQPVTYKLDLDAIDDLMKSDEVVSLPPLCKAVTSESLPDVTLEPAPVDKKAREAKEKQLRTGFIAQDVEETAKSIGYDFSGVDVDEAGIYGLRIAEFVVPLVKAVQELSAQNDRLQAQNDQMQAQISELTELVYSLLEKDSTSAVSQRSDAEPTANRLQDEANGGASLQQNIPNPFNQSTVIRYTLPQVYASAQLVVSNTAGVIVRKIPLQPGTNSITIESGALAVGVYYYALYVDSRLVDAKQMVLTK